MTEFFNIPHMRVAREDLEEYYPEADKLSDEQMEEVAKMMSKALMEGWDTSVRCVVDEIKTYKKW